MLILTICTDIDDYGHDVGVDDDDDVNDSCKSVQGDGAASITRQDSISACGIL